MSDLTLDQQLVYDDVVAKIEAGPQRVGIERANAIVDAALEAGDAQVLQAGLDVLNGVERPLRPAMNEFHAATICATCGTPIDTSLDSQGHRVPCPGCGETRRSHDVSLHLPAGEARAGLAFKAKRPGAKKPHAELKSGPSHSHSLGKPVEHERLIDRANDRYHENVTDYESGKVLHQADEPMSKHVGHGSAKKMRKGAQAGVAAAGKKKNA